MVRSMRLFLIRHGETVDNVARLYAGSRDSALTNHGYQQAKRLGQHLRALGLVFTHLFSSHLQRAAKTVGLIREAQLAFKGDADSPWSVPEAIQLRILTEQDFGHLEGKKWSDREVKLRDKLGSVAIETKDAMAWRADTYLDNYLLPLLEKSDGPDPIVALVSHGIFLSTLWKRLLQRLPAESVSLSSDLQSTARPSLQHLGWSNTGYLHLHMTREEADKPSSITHVAQPTTMEPGILQAAIQVTGRVTAPIALANDDTRVGDATSIAPASRIVHGWSTVILAINGKDHLKGLKRTGGGVGSSRHDASQRVIESFFKRRKVG